VGIAIRRNDIGVPSGLSNCRKSTRHGFSVDRQFAQGEVWLCRSTCWPLPTPLQSLPLLSRGMPDPEQIPTPGYSKMDSHRAPSVRPPADPEGATPLWSATSWLGCAILPEGDAHASTLSARKEGCPLPHRDRRVEYRIPYGIQMLFVVRLLRYRGRVLPWREVVNRRPLAGDLRVEQCYDEDLRRHVRMRDCWIRRRGVTQSNRRRCWTRG